MVPTNSINLSAGNDVSILNESLLVSSESGNETSKTNEPTKIMPEVVNHFLLVLILVLSLFGTIANGFNMKTFWKLRNEDSININLFALALSDTMVCLTSFGVFLNTAFWFIEEIFAEFRIVPVGTMYLVVGVPHSVSVRVTVLLTTSIAVQRCLCVVTPLKVRGYFTRSRVIALVVFCFCLPTLMIMIPLYYVNRLEWETIPNTNLTVLNHIMTPDFDAVNAWSVPTNTAVLLVIPFVAVSACTGIMISSLKRTMSWRLQVAHASWIVPRKPTSPFPPETFKRAAIVEKERRIVKMVLIVALVFLVCYFPNSVQVMFVAFTDYHNIKHGYNEISRLIGSVGFLLDTLNSSINIFIYYHTSSNYKKAFRALF